MTSILIVLIVIIILVILMMLTSIKVVPQSHVAVVERLGRFGRTAGPGVVFLVPFVDRVRVRVDVREQTASIPPQTLATEDNRAVSIGLTVSFQVTDPRAAVYEIANYLLAIEQLAITALRNAVGSMSTKQAMSAHDGITRYLHGTLDGAATRWGIRVGRVELSAIAPVPAAQRPVQQQWPAPGPSAPWS